MRQGQTLRQCHYAKRCGFTLLELAIVMAIIGTVTGVLFATAGIVRYRANLNTASSQLNLIVQNMRNLMAARSTSYAALTGSGFSINAAPTGSDFTSTSTALVQQFVFPIEMLSPTVPPDTTPPAATVAYTPWQTLAQVALADPTAGQVQFVVRYNALDADTCSDMLIRNSLPGKETGLMRIQVGGADVGIANTPATPLPISSVKAASVCPTGATYTIDWYYNL